MSTDIILRTNGGKGPADIVLGPSAVVVVAPAAPGGVVYAAALWRPVPVRQPARPRVHHHTVRFVAPVATMSRVGTGSQHLRLDAHPVVSAFSDDDVVALALLVEGEL